MNRVPEADLHRAYLQGANGYRAKPGNPEQLLTMLKSMKDYWLLQNRGMVACF